MNKVIKNSSALFLGIALIMIGYGFQGSLLGVRAVMEQFTLTSTGLMMSGYFVGYFYGAKVIPDYISRVGHIRVFAAFASLCSLVVLVHSIYVNPFFWFFLRFLTGVSMVCMFTVAESWLNDRSTNRNRGQILSIYMIVLYSGLAIGMILLNFSDPKDFKPFILISVLMSLALMPILLTKRTAPKFKKIQAMNLKQIYKTSPVGLISIILFGAAQSGAVGLLAVYAASMNFSIFDISLATFFFWVSGAIGQWPIGKISDLSSDRRTMLIYTTLASAVFAFLSIQNSQTMHLPGSLAGEKIWFYLSLSAYSFFSLPMFSLILAHTNDFIPKEKFVSAGAALQLAFGIGAMGGPFLCSILMDFYGPNGFFVFLIFFHILIGLFAIYRKGRRPSEDNPESQFTALPQTITPVGLELDPTTEPIEEK